MAAPWATKSETKDLAIEIPYGEGFLDQTTEIAGMKAGRFPLT
jgi:hypothetical protein